MLWKSCFSHEAGWTPPGNFLCENPCEKMFPKSAKMKKLEKIC